MRQCTYCAAEIAEGKTVCDDCRRELLRQASTQQAPPPQVPARGRHSDVRTELHSKSLKLQYAISAILFAVGTIGGCSAIQSQSEEGVAGFVVAGVVGFVWLLVTKIRMWWHHG